MKILKFLFPALALIFITQQTTFATSCPGVNRASHPYGLSYAAFDCYTDNYWIDDNYGGGQREQNFIRIRKNNTGQFSNSVTLSKAGDTALVFIYAHNSGKEDTYPANNVKISLDWSNLANVKGVISADNTNPRSVDDNVTINLGSNLKLRPLSLYYKGTKIRNLDPDSTRVEIGINSFNSSYKNAKYFFVSFGVIKEEPPKVPKISVAKVDANEGEDQDGVNGSKKGNIQFDKETKTVFAAEDSQTIQKGKRSKFKIIVKNSGEAPLKDVVLTDAKAPNCNRTSTQTAALIRKVGNRDTLLDPGEMFSYGCEKPSIQSGYVNEIQVTAVGAGTDKRTVHSGDRTEVLVEDSGTASISVAKVDANPKDQDGVNGSKKRNIEFDNAGKTQFTPKDSQLVNKGEASRFKVIVKNTGEVGLTNVILSDRFVPNCNRNESQTRGLIRKRGNKDVTLDPGEFFSYFCQKASTKLKYVNSITVSAKANGKLIGSRDRSEVVIKVDNGFCGDGKKGKGEQCDDGNDSNTDTCNNSCKLTTCGDGIIQNPNGNQVAEECDDGAKNGQKGRCSTSCKIVGGGGGGAPVVSSIGTCSVNGGGAYQCIGRKPYRNGEGWTDYVNCKTGNGGFDVTGIPGNTLEKRCVTAWAQYMNLDTCGNAGDSASNNANNCNPLPPVEPGVIPNTPICPGCFKANSFLVKTANKKVIARGDEVTYNLKLNLGISDLTHYRVTDAEVRFYDFSIPSNGSGSLWGRNGLSHGWLQAPAGGKYFKRYFGSGSNQITEINSHRGTEIELNYRMNSALASTADTASIDNVAFAVIDYKYRNINCNVTLNSNCGIERSQKVLLSGPGKDTAVALARWKNSRSRASFSTLGDTATIEIIRPFPKATNGGNFGFEFKRTRTDKVVATDEGRFGELTEGEILVKGNGVNSKLFDFNGYNGFEIIDDIDPLKSIQTEGLDKYYNNLKINADMGVIVPGLAGSFTKNKTQEVYFLESGSLYLNGELDLGGKNKTFIIDNGNLVIGKNGVTLKNGFAAFIVRKASKSILIDKQAVRMEGIFIAEKGSIKSLGGKISRLQLKVFGALMGDIEPLLNKRWFIGHNPEVRLEPNIEIEYDLRLLENTPPTLEKTLGHNWKERLQ